MVTASILFGLIGLGVSIYSIIDSNNKYDASTALANEQFAKSMQVTEALNATNAGISQRQELINQKAAIENAAYMVKQEREYETQKWENQRFMDNAHTAYGNPRIGGRI